MCIFTFIKFQKKPMMKNILIATTLFLTSFSINAQIESGTFMTGGSATFNRNINSDTSGLDISSTSIVINPQLGIAFADDFVLGAWFEFSSIKGISNVSSWSVAPFVRYYNNNFFLQLGYGFNRSGNVSGSIFDAELGYAMFLNDNISLEPAFYFNQYFNDNGLNGSDIGFKLGFQLYFNR